MEQEAAEQLVDVLEDNEYDASLDAEYSGRSMYGKTTYAVTTDADAPTVARLGEQRDLPRTRWDNMGMGYVYY